MLLVALAVLAAEAPLSRAPAPIAVQATATVRIVAGVRLKLDSPRNAGAPPTRDAIIASDGKLERARLIEFE
jgi:hypothetical protein